MRERLANLNRKSLSLVCLALGICLGLVGGFAFRSQSYNSNTRPDILATNVFKAPKFAKKISPTIEKNIWSEEYEKIDEDFKKKTRAQQVQAASSWPYWFKTEKEIIRWARTHSIHDLARTYRYQRPNKKIVAVLVSPMEDMSPNIYFFAHLVYPDQADGEDLGWSLMFYRNVSSSEISLWVGQNPDELYFRSKSGQVVLSADLSSLRSDF